MTSSAKTPGRSNRSSSKENRPIRVYAAILMLAILIAGILYFTRDQPIPKEIREAVSSGGKRDSVWTYSSSSPDIIALKMPNGNKFELEKNSSGIASFKVNGRTLTNPEEMEQYQRELAAMLNELNNRKQSQ
ncbi:hypothetical protein [Pseudobacter ginsenosidimutans]|uniref:Uncharacterized protein n=1 Tax=Pseudobacter ginsenosidimutans TaxID=661488 RepID=A0A4Q7MFK0_9BACT|nr:hypothetical protein [Pseudobacter ginsenosidimutans]QEC45378.1 hypothetical protein FSB84_28165 [Pseudobacter ginsenosidimutans]RZS66904.1 hypothetical protein EV199_5288 [Pseudobacter ginsenosidimutans]